MFVSVCKRFAMVLPLQRMITFCVNYQRSSFMLAPYYGMDSKAVLKRFPNVGNGHQGCLEEVSQRWERASRLF